MKHVGNHATHSWLTVITSGFLLSAGTLVASMPAIASDAWAQSDKLIASDGAADDHFGTSVAISGKHALIGAPDNDENGTDRGAAYVFKRSRGTWVQLVKLTASDGPPGSVLPGIELDVGADFGGSVAISGRTAVVGAVSAASAGLLSGAAYIFERQAGEWTEVARLLPDEVGPLDLFGGSVALAGDTAIVSSPGDDDANANAGAAYVFERKRGEWTLVDKLIPSDGIELGFFGRAALQGKRAVIGTANADQAYVFERRRGRWIETAKLTADDGEPGDRFGESVAIAGNKIIVGARSDDDGGENAGAVYVFERIRNAWTQVAKLTADDATPGENFGFRVAVQGQAIIVGAPALDAAVDNPGAAYVFRPAGRTWIQSEKLMADDAAPGDSFGRVAILGGTIMVGATGADIVEPDAGAVYVFRRY